MSSSHAITLLFLTVTALYFTKAAVAPFNVVNDAVHARNSSFAKQDESRRTLSPGSPCPAGQTYVSHQGCLVYNCDQCFPSGFSQTFDYSGRGRYFFCNSGCPFCFCWDCAACYPCSPGSFSSTPTSDPAFTCTSCSAGTYTGLKSII
jgi:hypothetical protein